MSVATAQAEPGSRAAIAAAFYETTSIGLADDTTNADGIKVFDYWQARDAIRRWAERQWRLDR